MTFKEFLIEKSKSYKYLTDGDKYWIELAEEWHAKNIKLLKEICSLVRSRLEKIPKDKLSEEHKLILNKIIEYNVYES